MNSDQIARDAVGNLYFTVVGSGGLYLRKYDSSGVYQSGGVIDPVGYSPSITYDLFTNKLYIVYVKTGSSPLSRQFIFRRYSVADLLTPEWSTNYDFFTPIDASNPRIISSWSNTNPSSARVLRVSFVNQDYTVSILSISPDDGSVITRFETGYTTTNPSEVTLTSYRFSMYLCMQRETTKVQVVKYNSNNYARNWVTEIDVSTPDAKSNYQLVENPLDSTVYVSYRCGTTDFRVSSLTDRGVINWSSSIISITNSIGNRLHNMYLFEDTPLLTFVRTTGFISFTKISPVDGSVISPPRETLLSGFIPSSLSSAYPLVSSVFPWDKVFVGYVDTTSSPILSLYNSPTTSIISEPTSQLTQYQLCSNSNLTTNYIIYRNVSDGGIYIMSSTSGNVLNYDTKVSNDGQTPALTCSGSTLFYTYARFLTSFSEYLEITITRVSAFDVSTNLWSSTFYLPITVLNGIRPRLSVSGNRLSCWFCNADGYVVIRNINSTSGSLTRQRVTNVRSGIRSEVASYSASSTSSILVATPSYTDTRNVVTAVINPNTLETQYLLEYTVSGSPLTTIFVAGAPNSTSHYVVAKNSSNAFFAGGLAVSGTSLVLSWNNNMGITSAVNNQVIGCYLFSDYLLAFYLDSSITALKCVKVTTSGAITSKTTGGVYLTQSPVSGDICISSSGVFDKYFISGYNATNPGAVAASSGGLKVLAGSVSITYGSNSISEQTSYQHCVQNNGVQYVITRDTVTGLKLVSYTSASVQTNFAPITFNGYHPSIVCITGNLYYSYLTLRTTLTNYIELITTKIREGINTDNTVNVVWSKTLTHPDDTLDTFFPRLVLIGDFLSVLYVRNNDRVYGISYNNVSGRERTSTSLDLGLTVTHSDKREFRVTRTEYAPDNVYYIYTAFPETSSGNVRVSRYSSSLIQQWNTLFNGGLTDPKTNLIVKEEYLTRTAVVAYTNNSSPTPTYRVTVLNNAGTIVLGSINSTLTGLIFDRLSSMYVFDEYILLFGVRTDGSVDTIKIVLATGNLVTPVKNNVVGFSVGALTSPYSFISYDPWNVVNVSYISSITNNLVVQTLTATTGSSITITDTELSEYQSTINSEDSIFTTYYNGSEGVSVSRFLNNGDVIQRSIDVNGQTPSIHCLPGDSHVYISYVKNVDTFTSYLAVTVRKLSMADLSEVWYRDKLYTDASPNSFRPRIQVSESGVISTTYRNNADQIITHFNLASDGTLSGIVNTGYSVYTAADPRNLAVRISDNRLYVAYPDSANSIAILDVDISAKTVSQLTNLETLTDAVGAKSNITVRYSSEYGIYLTVLSGANIKLALFNPTGTLIWQKSVTDFSVLYGPMIHAFYLTEGFPILFGIDNLTGDLTVKKYDNLGNLISSRTKNLETFDPKLFVTPPVLLSRPTWETIWMIDFHPGSPYYSNWLIIANKLNAPLIPDPTESIVPLSDKQYVIDNNDNIYVGYVQQYKPDITTIPSNTPDLWLNDYGVVSLLTPKTDNGIRLRATYLSEESSYGPSFDRIKMVFENRSGFGTLTRVTSTTSHSFTTGLKTFVVTIPAETIISEYTPGKRIKAWVNGNEDAFLEGQLVSLVGTNLTINVDKFTSTGSNNDWVVELTGFIFDIKIDSTSLPSGVVFYGFNLISVLGPNEVYETYVNIDFNNNVFDPVVINLKMSIGDFTVSLYAPTSDLFFRATGPNVVSINRLDSTGVVRQTVDVDLGGQSPVLYNSNGDVYLAYVKKLVGFTDFISLSVRKLNSSFDVLWLYDVNFEDSLIEYFVPRLEKTTKGLHVCYFKQDGILYIDTLDPMTGANIGTTYETSVTTTITNSGNLATYSTDRYLYVALPGASGIINLTKYDMTSPTPLVWSVSFNGGTTNNKTNLIVKSSQNDLYVPDENIFISYTDNNATVTLTMVKEDSTVLWSTDSGLSMADVYGNRVHGMFVYGGFPILLFIRDRTTYVSCTSIKYNEFGTVIDTIDTAAPVELEPAFIQGSPAVLSRTPWETIFIEFYTNTYIEDIETVPILRLAVVAVDVPFTYNITVTESELSSYQVGKLTSGETFVVYTSGGVKLLKLDSMGGLLSNTTIDVNGQSPCLVIDSNRIYISYMRYQAAFVGSSAYVVRVYNASDLTELAVNENEYPDPQTSVFRPRMSISDDYLFSSYVRQDTYLYIERMSLATNTTDLVVRTSLILSSINPLDIVSYSGASEFNLAYSLGGDTYVYRYDDSLTQTWSQSLGFPTGDLLLRVYLGTYLGYRDSLNNLKLVKFNSLTGGIEWTYNYGTPPYVGGRLHSLYNLFSYPLTFNVKTNGDVNVVKLNEDGQLVSSRDTPLSGLNIAGIQNYPVLVSGSPWDNVTLVYYTSFGGGVINVSGSKAIAVNTYMATVTNPTPLPITEVSENQLVTDGGDYAFLVTSDDTNGLLLTRHLRSTGAITHSVLITAQKPFSPCLRYHNNRVYLSYCVYSVGYTEIIEMFIDVFNSSDLSLIISTSRGLPDPQPGTFRPRISISGNYLQRVFVRFSNLITLDRFDLTTYELSDTFNTGVSYLGGDNRNITIHGHDNVFELSYPLISDPTKISVTRISEDDYMDVKWSNQLIDGGYSLESKTYPMIRVDNSGNVYLSYTSASARCVLTKLSDSTGLVSWNQLVINETSGRVSHGMDIFEGFPMVYTIKSTNQVVFSKFNDEGVQVSGRTTTLTGFNYAGNVTGVSPYLVTGYPWDSILVVHNTSNLSLYYQSGRNIATRTYSSPAVYVLPPNNNDVRTSQGVFEDNGTSQAVSYTSSLGGTVYYFNGTSITGTRNISSTIYNPSIAKLHADMESYITYMRSFNTFTEVSILGLRKLTYSASLTDVWVNENLIIPDGTFTNFRPLVKVYADRFFVVYVRENNKLIVESYNKTTGALITRITTNYYVPNPTELVIDGDYDLCISYLNGGDEIGVIKFNTQDGEFAEAWSSTISDSNSLDKRQVEIVQNISERIVIAYTAFNPTSGLLDAYVVNINQLTGDVIWSLPAFTDIPITDRLTGIGYEGSFVNTSRVGLQLIDSDPNTIDVSVFSVNSLGSVTKTFNNSLPSGTPLYSGNPLIMFNNGEGWVIMAYRDTTGTFRMIRVQLFEGSTRVEFDSDGNCITPGYDFWWRPLITINPATSGPDIEESTVVNGKIQGVYRRWFSNGHLQADLLYNDGEVLTSKYFTEDGQWDKYTASCIGNSTYYEFNLPGRANLLAIFNNFDSNSNGFITPAELKTGIESYGLTIPDEELDLLILRADKNEDGNLDYEEFARILPISVYTKPITSEIGFDSAIKSMECAITDNKRNGLCTSYFSSLPSNQVRETSTYLDGVLNGTVTTYHPDNSVARVVTYVNGKITGTVTEYYDNSNSNSIKSVTGYSPPGYLDGNYILYNPAGWPEIVKEQFIIPNIPAIRFRTTFYWSATQIKFRYYLDINRSRVDSYVEYYPSGAVKFTGPFLRDLKEGLWTEYYESPNVKHFERFYVKNRLSGPGAVKVYSTTGILLESIDYPVYS